MRLPDLSQLSESSHHFLYHHDQDEFHCTNPYSFSRRMYMARYEAVMQAVRSWSNSLGKTVREIKIIDIGCAQGNFSLTLAEQGYRVFAVDLQLSFLRYLRLKYEHGELYCINATLEALPFRDTFDIVLLGEVIEHVANPDVLLKIIGKLMTSSGLLIVTTPNGERLFTGMPTLSQVKDRSSLVAKQYQPDADGHLYLLTQHELEAEARKAGLTVAYHHYFGTPWITGRMKFRIWVKLFPLRLTHSIDKFFLKVPALARRFAEGQLVVAKPTKDDCDRLF
jgi:2-polyprenyl-6-hydroxyphenyl methylase/3-demethylubiquinone-9 3-methyltransferase